MRHRSNARSRLPRRFEVGDRRGQQLERMGCTRFETYRMISSFRGFAPVLDDKIALTTKDALTARFEALIAGDTSRSTEATVS